MNYLKHSELQWEKNICSLGKTSNQKDKEVFNYICTLSYFLLKSNEY